MFKQKTGQMLPGFVFRVEKSFLGAVVELPGTVTPSHVFWLD